ncbi:thermonuclease family protein [Sphingobacterium wenxiniae]|nr:thermonuclease family protein [Sphingobacterium wenxiniae]
MLPKHFLNADLVKKGYAVVATFPPNVKHVDEFMELQEGAREYKLGVWGE